MDQNSPLSDYRNMSSKESEEYITFLLTRDGYVCTDKHEHGCGRSIQELLEIREAEELATSRQFKTKAITIDHINGDSNQRDGPNGEYCGNLQLLCWSCNRRKGGYKRLEIQTSGEHVTREKQDALEGVPQLINWATANLIKEQEACFKELIMASRKANGQSPVTNERNLGYEIYTEFNHNGRFQIFPFNCGSRNCKSEHICLTGYKPEKLIQQEREKLKAEWMKEFGISQEEHEKKQWGSIRGNGNWRPYMTFDEYIQAHGKLTVHKFIEQSPINYAFAGTIDKRWLEQS